ncbi:uncharacterized protein DS421_16g561380 [Arachis hypogaea]|nr:uncharacterized protein DS421_16g561380 [Arachis hypogaea]
MFTLRNLDANKPHHDREARLVNMKGYYHLAYILLHSKQVITLLKFEALNPSLFYILSLRISQFTLFVCLPPASPTLNPSLALEIMEFVGTKVRKTPLHARSAYSPPHRSIRAWWR